MRYVFIIFSFIAVSGFAQDRVLIDGKFGEWNNIETAYTDVSNDGGISGVDFGVLKIYNDPDFVFFLLETTEEINLQNNNEITIYLDTDQNATTGLSINGIGAELSYKFGNRSGSAYIAGNALSISHDNIFLVTAPTVTSTKFEIAIKRDARLFGIPLFPANQFRVTFEDQRFNGDVLPSENGGISYTFKNEEQGPLPLYSIQQPERSDIRILSYNILSSGLFNPFKEAYFKRILRVVDAQIIGFQEAYAISPSLFLSKMEEILPSDSGEKWYHAEAPPDIHVMSRYPILESYEIPGYNSGQGNGAFLIDVPDLEEDLLFIVAHPPCCNNEVDRQIELDAIMAFLREVKEGRGPFTVPEGAPIILTGDMNLVGGQGQLETLLTGNISNEAIYGPDFRPDWDGSDLVDAHPYVTNLPMSFTWFDEQSSFSPGRLDFCLYSGSNLQLENSYSLFTDALSQDSLTTYDLLSVDASSASDHLPLVADFSWKKVTSSNKEPQASPVSIEVFPAPTSELTTVTLNVIENSSISLSLIDMQGREQLILPKQTLTKGVHSINFEVSQFPKGTYILRLNGDHFMAIQKLIIL